MELGLDFLGCGSRTTLALLSWSAEDRYGGRQRGRKGHRFYLTEVFDGDSWSLGWTSWGAALGLRWHYYHGAQRTAMVGGSNQIKNAKLVLLGDVGTGKSSLVLRFVIGQFVEFQQSTIGAAFFSQVVSVNGESVKFEIWDTAGQERYHSLAPMYYRGAAAAVVVYDITNSATFTRAKKWVQELQAQGSSNTIIALAGNKADLLEARQVTTEEAQTYAQDNGLYLMETSAKTAINVNDIFYEIAKRLTQVKPVQNPQGMTLTGRPDDKPVAAASCCSS
ncbi:hypothetical protein ZIOFF_046423 [Zingiber officinale]|uniref:Uncharacterized protein n=1 Tax=Zingiber officinale TaxID=94328 RepID=A0A8J5G8G3_ZINOF|nr:hypothetical protein ZIOFF_046423 [Zingiber officinale]